MSRPTSRTRAPASSGVDRAPPWLAQHQSTPPRAHFDRYLGLLGVERQLPGLPALRELTFAHLTRVPFENVSKLLHRADPSRRLPSLLAFLDGIEHERLGGTCYANNFHLHQLLRHLGYDVALCGADMSAPDVHLVNVVTLAGTRYLVDGGYGAPLLEPLALELARPQAITCGRDEYVLEPTAHGAPPALQHYRDGALRHGYRVNPRPRTIDELAAVIDDSFRPDATFMNALMFARFSRDRALTLRNLTLTEASGATWQTRELVRSELPEVLETELGVPRAVTAAALEGVELSQNG